MKWIYLFAGVFMLIACGSANNGGESVASLEGEYQIVRVGNAVLDDTEFLITFDIEEQRAYSYVGCNRISSSFTQKGNTLDFSQGISTKMYCDGKMEIEGRVLGALEEITGVRPDNGNIVLYSSDNADLITIKKQ